MNKTMGQESFQYTSLPPPIIFSHLPSLVVSGDENPTQNSTPLSQILWISLSFPQFLPPSGSLRRQRAGRYAAGCRRNGEAGRRSSCWPQQLAAVAAGRSSRRRHGGAGQAAHAAALGRQRARWRWAGSARRRWGAAEHAAPGLENHLNLWVLAQIKVREFFFNPIKFLLRNFMNSIKFVASKFFWYWRHQHLLW